MNDNPVDPIISSCGGEAATAAACKITPDAIRKWRLNGFVPPKNWPRVIELSCGAVTYAQLENLWRAAGATERESIAAE